MEFLGEILLYYNKNNINSIEKKTFLFYNDTIGNYTHKFIPRN